MNSQWRLRGRRVNCLIKRIQSGTTQFSSVASNITVTVLACDTANSILIETGYRNGYTVSQAASVQTAEAILTDATTLTFGRGSFTNTAGDFVAWMLVEFWPGVVERIQVVNSSIVAGGSSVDNTILPVDLNRTLLFSTDYTNGDVSAVAADLVAIRRLTTNSNLHFERTSSPAAYVLTQNTYVVTFR